MLNFLPDFLRAIIYIVAGVVLARFYLKFIDFPSDNINRWFGAWVLLSIAAFASGHFVVFSLITLAACMVLSRAPGHFAPATYVILLPLIPLFDWTVPGFAGINRILSLDYQRVLTLIVLLPALMKKTDDDRLPRRPVIANAIDFCFLGYVGWLMLLSLIHRDSVTDKLRYCVENFLFLLVPYLACSRLIRNFSQLRAVIIALAFSGIIESFIGMVEQRMTWWSYQLIPTRLQMDGTLAFAFGAEIRFGFLRIRGALDAGLGIFLVFTLASFIALWRMKLIQGWKAWLTVGVFAVPIFFTGSRGSWLACALMLAATVGFAFIRTPVRFVFAAVFAAIIAPTARNYILGKDDFGTFDYRTELINTALPMAWEKPIFGWGSLEKLFATGRLEHLRQGQGIIDFVNWYLGEAVLNGIPGFLLFCGVLFFSLWSVLLRHQAGGSRGFHPETAAMLAAMVVSFAFLMMTISAVSHIPSYIYLLAALCSAFACLPPDSPGDAGRAAPAPSNGRRRLRRMGQTRALAR